MRPAPILLAILFLANLPSAHAQEKASWLGQIVFPKIDNLQITRDGADGRSIPVAILNEMYYQVRADQDGKLKLVTQNGLEGWISKNDALPPAEAAKYFSSELEKNPQDTGLLRKRASARDLNGELDLAIKDYEEIIRVSPDADAYLGRGNVYLAKKDNDKAIADFTEAIRLDPPFATAYLNRGLALQAKNEPDKAIADYTEALRLNPGYVRAMQERGRAWSSKKDYDKAIADFNEAIRLDPSDAWAFDQRGLAWEAKKDPGKAIADFKEALRLNPRYHWPHLSIGVMYFKQREYEKALEHLNASLKVDPNLDYTYCYRGYVYSAQKEYDKAEEDLAKAVRLGPKEPRNHRYHSWFLATCADAKYRDGKKALGLAKKAFELTKEGEKDPGICACLAAAYAEVDDFEEAVRWEERALQNETYSRDEGEKARKRLALYRNKQAFRDE